MSYEYAFGWYIIGNIKKNIKIKIKIPRSETW